MKKQEFGEYAESLAVKYLESYNVTVLHRNFRTKCGEIDIIAQDGDILVFVEVRCKQNQLCGSALESVDFNKQRKIMLTAEIYLQQYFTRRGVPLPYCRFDVIGINSLVDSSPSLLAATPPSSKLVWIKNAFE